MKPSAGNSQLPHPPARDDPPPAALQVKEIHADVRMQLPSIGMERGASSDEDDEPPIMTAHYGNPAAR